MIQNAFILAKDQSGCRRLQKKIDEQTESGNLRFFEELLDSLMEHIGDLMKDSFANYLCQKFFKNASEDKVNTILRSVSYNSF